MSHVHYKFKSSLHYDSATFDGQHISLGDLKKAIIEQKKLGKSMEMFRLQITDAQSNQEYKEDSSLIQKNTSVIVARIPIGTGSKPKSWDKASLAPIQVPQTDTAAPMTLENLSKVTEFACEDDKLDAMRKHSTKAYDPSNYLKMRPTGPPPASYVCYKCMKPGHWIHNCPGKDAKDDGLVPAGPIRASTGIPHSFLTKVSDPNVQGAFLTPAGFYAVPTIDAEAYKQGKKEKPPFVPGHKEAAPLVKPLRSVPTELVCTLCSDIYKDAVVVPCCGTSFCDECIRNKLLESDDHECPSCSIKTTF